jgi:hypothetical protein
MSVDAGSGAREELSADGVFSGGGIKGLAFAGALAIPTGEVSTLNFSLSAGEKEYLYDSRLKAAQAFFASSPTGENSYGKVP